MKTFLAPIALLALTLFSPTVFAQQASQAEVDRLLEVMRVEQQAETMLPQMLAAQKQMVERMAAGKDLDAGDRKRLDSIMDKQHAAMRDVLAWEKLEPVYGDIYRKTFTDAEVQSLIEFYSSPAGQGFLDKMPLLMQNTMAAMQELVVPMMKQLEQDLLEETKPD